MNTPNIMQTLSDEFNNRPKDEKLVMGYLASGNSAYDILKLLVEYMQISKEAWNMYLEEITASLKENAEENGEVTESGIDEAIEAGKQIYLDAYKSLGDHINSPIAG